jgi:hypothetical protein
MMIAKRLMRHLIGIIAWMHTSHQEPPLSALTELPRGGPVATKMFQRQS